MKVRSVITAVAAAATVTVGTVAGFASPSYALPTACTTYDQGGWNGDVCVTYIAWGGIFRTNAHVTAFPVNCATIRVDLLNMYGVVNRAGTAVACQTGTITGGVNCSGQECIDPRERAIARLNAYDRAGNQIFTAQTDVLASSSAPPLP